MKNYQRYETKSGKPVTFEMMARKMGLKPEIKENTRIEYKGEYFLVHDINPRNRKFPILIKNRDKSLKATVGFVNASNIITY